MTKILVIPDAHATPGISNDRFEWLGKFIVDEKPERIVCIGDWADMPSLSSYDKGKKSYEGKRYRLDCEVAIDAQERMFKPIAEFNKLLRKKKVKQYTPELDMCLGNHCFRIIRATNNDPMLDGTIGIDDLQFEEYGWKVHRYLDIVDIEGIYFSHCMTKGVMDSVVSGTPATLGANILKEMKDNALAGHSHLLSISNAVLPSGRKIWGGSVGCYFEHKVDYVSKKAQDEWSRGLLIVNVEKREIQDLSWTSLNTLKREYGRK